MVHSFQRPEMKQTAEIDFHIHSPEIGFCQISFLALATQLARSWLRARWSIALRLSLVAGQLVAGRWSLVAGRWSLVCVVHTYLYVVRFPLTNLLVVHVRLLSEFVPAIALSRCGLRFLCAVTAFLYQRCVRSCFP